MIYFCLCKNKGHIQPWHLWVIRRSGIPLALPTPVRLQWRVCAARPAAPGGLSCLPWPLSCAVAWCGIVFLGHERLPPVFPLSHRVLAPEHMGTRVPEPLGSESLRASRCLDPWKMLGTVVHAGFLGSGLVTFFSYVLASDNQEPTFLFTCCWIHNYIEDGLRVLAKNHDNYSPREALMGKKDLSLQEI